MGKNTPVEEVTEEETPLADEVLADAPVSEEAPAEVEATEEVATDMPLPVDGTITADPDYVVEVETVVSESGSVENVYADLDNLNKVPTAYSNPPAVIEEEA